MISSRALARNAMLNVMGQVLPMLAAVIAIPILIRELGAPRFGVLTLAWAAIGYFSLFDFGLSRALTQAVASRLGSEKERDELPTVAWTALTLMLALGIVGGAVLALASPWLVRGMLKIPAALGDETIGAFYLLAVSLPAVVSTAGLRGLLEAHQDFGTATILRVPLAVFTFVGPLAVLPFSRSLVPIVGVLAIARTLTWVAHLVVCLRRYAYLRRRVVPRADVVLPLLKYGGWMTTSNIASPIMVYLDRFFIGATLALTAVAHYVTPYEIVTRMLALPQAMIGVLFPAFAATFAANPERTALLYERSVRVLILLMFPLLLVVMLFAREGLSRWVGPSFADASTPVLRWLVIGVFVNSLAQAPFAVLQGIGRPDLTAKLHLLELPLYVAVLALLADAYGIVGVAMAWTLRATVDAAALFALVNRHVASMARVFERTMLIGGGAIVGLGVGAFVEGPVAKPLFLLAVLAAFGVLGWARLMQPAERAYVREWSRS